MVSKRTAATVTLVALCLVGGVALLGGSAAAGDSVGLFDFQPGELDADSGDTVTVETTLRAHGGYGGEGVQSINQTVTYDPEVLTVVDVERGPWLEQGNETDIVVSSEIDDAAGRVTVEQYREEGGATGEAATLRLTVEVADDASPSDAVLQHADAEVILESDLPQATRINREGVIHIDGGGDRLAPLEEDDEDEGPGIVTPEETPTPTDAENTSDDAESQTGFGVAVALTALFAFAVARTHRK